MEIPELYSWNVSYKQAVRIQEHLKNKVSLTVMYNRVGYIAGLDLAYSRKSNAVWAGAVVLEFPSLARIEEKCSEGEAGFPYVPGFLGFREIPALIAVLKKIECDPDLILCDGHGIAHPRGIGLASHLGVILNKPTIGCAKDPLVGGFFPVEEHRGAHEYIRHKEKVVGAALRTKEGVKPVFVSPGHGITLMESIRFVLNTSLAFRIPEPIRMAHLLASSSRSSSDKN